eukprot:3436592-Prymnesium_polylepis.1
MSLREDARDPHRTSRSCGGSRDVTARYWRRCTDSRDARVAPVRPPHCRVGHITLDLEKLLKTAWSLLPRDTRPRTRACARPPSP